MCGGARQHVAVRTRKLIEMYGPRSHGGTLRQLVRNVQRTCPPQRIAGLHPAHVCAMQRPDRMLKMDPADLRLLFQGVSDEARRGKSYGQIPWRLGILQPDRQSP